MESRRSFIRKSGGAMLSTAAMAGIPALAMGAGTSSNRSNKKMIIGIIGAENSHTIGYGNLFNTHKKFPGMEVKYVWGETDEFAARAAERGNIPNIVKDPSEMMGKIDALIVDHRHAKYHLDAAEPFVREGIPTFIDKPFCYRVDEGKEFLAMARDVGTPVSSFSSVRQSDASFDIKEQLEAMDEIGHVVRAGPVEIDSQYGGIFFYGIHTVEPVLLWFGEDVEKVRVNRNGSNATGSLAYADGRLVTLVFKESRGWDTYVETKDGFLKMESRVEESDPTRNYIDMVEMFRTGKEPRSHSSILASIAVLEALEKSVSSEEWVDVPGID